LRNIPIVARSCNPIAAVAVWYNAGMEEAPTTAEPVKKARSRWFCLSPDWLVIGAPLSVGLLWLSDRLQWFGFNHHKGWTVLIAVAAVGAAALTMLLWWAVSLIFHLRFQFGIRSVLVFCLACSIALSWFAVERDRARRQSDILGPIRNSGGLVGYDWQLDAVVKPFGNFEPPEPDWLRKMLGEDFFEAVVGIIDTSDLTDAGLERLKDLTQLRGLSIFHTQITDAGLVHLQGLTQLRELSLNGTQITDAGLEHLQGLTHLQELWLRGSKITDAGMDKLQKALPNCKIVR
jgi:hypothetical protein